MMRKKPALVLTLFALALSLAAFTPALAQIPLPMLLYGDVSVVGPERTIGAPVGAVVSAWVGGVEKGSIVVTEEGKYGGPTILQPKLLVQDDIPENSLVEFKVNGFPANETTGFRSGEIQEFNLTVNDDLGPEIVDPTPAPDETKVIANPTISASYFDLLAGVDPATVVIEVDNEDVTAQATVTTTGVSYAPTLEDGVHGVKVIVEDRVGNESSLVWSFRVHTSPPGLLAPALGAKLRDNTPTFYWEAIPGVTYELEIDEDNEFTPPSVLFKPGLTENSYELAPEEGLADGTYWWRVRAVDPQGNRTPWADPWWFEVRVVPPVIPPPTDVFFYDEIVPPGVGVDFGENTPITQLELDVTEAVDNVRVTVRQYVERPAEVWIGAPGMVYTYLEFIKENITDAQIRQATIRFKVPRWWVVQNGVDPDNIKMFRFDEEAGRWVELPTSRIGEDATYYYYEAVTPELSWFAISGFRIIGAPAFRLGDLSISPSVADPGQVVVISCLVANVGDAEGVYVVTLWINGVPVKTKQVMLRPGESTRVTFEWVEEAAGLYVVEVDGLRGTFSVKAVIPPPPPPPIPWVLLISLAVVVVAMVIVVVRVRPRVARARAGR